MAVTIEGTVVISGATSTTAAFVIPAAALTGDFAVAVLSREVYTSVGITSTPPGQGWFELDTADGTTSGDVYSLRYYGCWLHTADAGTTHTFTFGSIWRSARLVMLRGVSRSDYALSVLNPAAGNVVTSGTSVNAQSETSSLNAGSIVFRVGGTWDDRVKTFPATSDGYTNTTLFGTLGNLDMSSATYTTAGSVSALSITYATMARPAVGKTLIVRAAVGSPTPTRFYLPSTGTPDISPAYSTDWEITADADRMDMVTTKIASAMATKTINETTAVTTAQDILARQYISAPIAAQTIRGTVHGQIRVLESNAAADHRAQVTVRVVSGDGNTVRGTLLAADTEGLATSTGLEFTTTLVNRFFPRSMTQLAEVTAQDGDRLVVEIGLRTHNTASQARTADFRFGDAAGTDLAVNETTTTDNDPWIEFGATIAPAGGGAITGTGGITITAPALAATALETFTGTSAVTIQKPALAGTAAQTFSGTSTLAIQKPALAATGAETFTATGALAIQKPAIDASGLRGYIGSGDLTIAAPALAATGLETFTGTATITVQKPAIDAAGTSLLAITGTGALTILAPALDGSGIELFTGTATVTIGTPAIAASGSLVFSGTSNLTIAVPALSGSGIEQFTGTVTLIIGAPALDASGSTGDVISGSGTLTIAVPAIASSGVETFAGSATVTIQVPSFAATGAESFIGTGALTISVPAIAATGSEVFSGTGALIIDQPSLASSGFLTFTGTATLTISVPGLAGSGTATTTVQIALADADITVGLWTTETGATTNLYQSIDEAASDTADYVQSPLDPTTSVYRVRLSDVDAPEAGVREITWVIRKSPTDSAQVDAVLRLYQGAVLVQTFTRTDVPDTWTEYTETLTEAVSNYADLEVEMEASQV